MSRNQADDEVKGEGGRRVPLKTPKIRDRKYNPGTTSVFMSHSHWIGGGKEGET